MVDVGDRERRDSGREGERGMDEGHRESVCGSTYI
jgi:hypothetical protein